MKQDAWDTWKVRNAWWTWIIVLPLIVIVALVALAFFIIGFIFYSTMPLWSRLKRK